MQLQRILLALGVGVLYIGYAGVLGVLVRRARRPQRRTMDIFLAAAHGVLLFLPASVVVLGLGDLPLLVRFILLGLGLAVAAVGWVQPPWTPQKLWRRTFGYRYFALAMGMAAIWGLSAGMSVTSLALGAAAGIACALTLNLTLSDPLR
jgi:hypothetical protein